MSGNRRSRRVYRAMTSRAALATLVAAMALGPHTPRVQAASDPLEAGFKSPPSEARPRVWWHSMNGNVTKEGITLDLEWMKRVGIGGVQMFDANIGNILIGEQDTAQVVDKRIVYRTPEWKDMLHHAAAECDRLGLEMTMHSSGGWSETGGPWVKPEEAMKKLVWSETRVDGPRKFQGTLKAPPSVNGNFQDLPFRPMFGPPPPPGADPTYYGDSAVIAYRVPDGEARMADLQPKVTRSGGDFDVAAIVDGDLNKTVALPIPEGGAPAWIQLEFAKPFTARAVSIAIGSRAMPRGTVQASQDGIAFTNLASLPGPSHFSLSVRTYAFEETTARFYRMSSPHPCAGSSTTSSAPLRPSSTTWPRWTCTAGRGSTGSKRRPGLGPPSSSSPGPLRACGRLPRSTGARSSTSPRRWARTAGSTGTSRPGGG